MGSEEDGRGETIGEGEVVEVDIWLVVRGWKGGSGGGGWRIGWRWVTEGGVSGGGGMKKMVEYRGEERRRYGEMLEHVQC